MPRTANPFPAGPAAAPDRARLAALIIALAALALRSWNLGWALPNATRLFSYHPDETMVVSASLAVNPLLLLLDPGFYAYGALPMLLNGAVIHGGEMLGLVGPSVGGAPSAGALLAARLVTATLGAATCLFLYGAGRLLFGRASGLISAALYALAPLAVQHGHFATVDVPATFFVAGALFFAARAASESEARPRDLLWAGVWAGLAAACKYNAGLVLLAGLATWWLAGHKGRGLAQLLGGALGAFLLGCPTIVLNPGGVLQSIRDESAHVASGHGDVFADTAPGFVYHLTYNLPWALTLPLTVFALLGVVGAVVRRGRGDGILAAFALPYYVLIGLAAVKFARYTLPLFPPLLLWAGAVPALLAARRPAAGKAYGALLGLSAGWALLFAVGLNRAMGGPDPRDEAAAFLRSRPDVRSVGFAKGPWFFSPPLAPALAHPIPFRAQEAAAQAASPRLIPCVLPGSDGRPRPVEWSAELLNQTTPDAVAVSEFEYADAERARRPEALAWLETVQSAYPERRVFARPVQVFGLPFTNLDAERKLPTQHLPEDMRYPNPTEVVFFK